MTKRFIISDTHFYHEKMIKYEARPFASVEEMNKTMINNWNKVVSKRDIVYHLGDFSFSNFEMIKKIFDQLKGRIILIAGNHDRRKTKSWWKRIGFEEVYYNPIVIGNMILSHEPVSIDMGDVIVDRANVIEKLK